MKMYVLVRRDLPKGWYAPQACHAVAEYAIDNLGFDDWKNGTIIIKGVKDKRELCKCTNFLDDNFNELGVEYSYFSESYQDTGVTSMAFLSEKDLFPHLDLL